MEYDDDDFGPEHFDADGRYHIEPITGEEYYSFDADDDWVF